MSENKEKFTVTRHKTGQTLVTADNLAWLFEKPVRGDFFMMHQITIVDDKRLDRTDLRVYFALCKHMEHGGWIEATQQLIAERTSIAKTHVSTSCKKLVETGYLAKERHAKTGRMIYRIDSLFASKGSTAMRKSQL